MAFTKNISIFFSIDNPLLLWGGGKQEEKSPAEFRLLDFDRILKEDPRVHLWVKEKFDVVKKSAFFSSSLITAMEKFINKTIINQERNRL